MAQPGTPAILSERRWVTLFVVALAQLVVVLDATIVNIARPSAQRALGFPDSGRQRVVTAYALAFGSLLLLRTAVARSGQARVNLVMYPPDGGRCIVLAPKDEAGGDPGWYRILMAGPRCPVRRSVTGHSSYTPTRSAARTRQASLCLGSAGCSAGSRGHPGHSSHQTD